MYINNKHNAIGAHRIKITPHAQLRAIERMGDRAGDLKTLCTAARNKGFNLDAVTINNYKAVGMSYNELVSLKRHFRTRNNSERIYLHKGFVYIFAGKDACTLKTVVKLRNVNI